MGFFDPDVVGGARPKRVRDARLFEPSSMRRAVSEDGVVLLLGELAEHPRTEPPSAVQKVLSLFGAAALAKCKKSERASLLRWWGEVNSRCSCARDGSGMGVTATRSSTTEPMLVATRPRRCTAARGPRNLIIPRPQRLWSRRGDWASSPDVVLSPV